MRQKIWWLAVLAQCANAMAQSPASVVPAQQNKQGMVAVELVDGSTFQAKLGVSVLSFRTGQGLREVPIGQIVQFLNTPAAVRGGLELDNGDRLHASLAVGTLEFETGLGKTVVSTSKIRAITFRPGSEPAVAPAAAGIPGLVLHYSFDLNEANAITDATGRHPGTAYKAPWTGSGKIGGARTFNGRDSVIEVSDAGDFDALRDLTFCAWAPRPVPQRFCGSGFKAHPR
jgi:hypothetical protein